MYDLHIPGWAVHTVLVIIVFFAGYLWRGAMDQLK